MRFEALADDGVVMRGEPLKLSFAVGNRGPADVTVSGVDLAGLSGASATCSGVIKKASAYTCTGTGAIPASAGFTGPYWTPRSDSARYDFDPDAPFGLPFRPSPFKATFHVSVGNAEIQIPRVLQFRYDNVVAGEKRMELSVAPAFSVRLAPDILIFPATRALGAKDTATRRVQVVVTNQHKGPAEGTVALTVPQGWTAIPARATVKFAREDEETTLRFDVSRPATAGPRRLHDRRQRQ